MPGEEKSRTGKRKEEEEEKRRRKLTEDRLKQRRGKRRYLETREKEGCN